MKKVAIVLVLLTVVSVVVFAETDKEPLPSDRLVSHLSYCITKQKQELTAKQEKAIRLVHPLLVVAAKNEYCRKGFWKAVATSEATDIEWEDAKRMILEGKVTEVLQAHSLTVWLVGVDGRRYQTKEPQIDEVYHLCKEVDPKNIFIEYGTE